MSGDDKPDGLGRRQPSKYLRKKRATKAAQQRWKEKLQLLPGLPLPWSERSRGNKQRQLAASKKGGEATAARIKEQQRLFWRWFYGDCKEQLRGPFKTVVETFERIEAAYNQRYGRNDPKWLAWEGFVAEFFETYIFSPCTRLKPEVIEREMWQRYEVFMEADDGALYGGLLGALHNWDDRQDRKKLRLEMWRRRVEAGLPISKRPKKRRFQ